MTLQKSIICLLICLSILCGCIFAYSIYNMWQTYELSDNKNYKYHVVCINNHLYIRMIPRLGVSPVFDPNFTDPKLISCSVKNGKIIYDKDLMLLLNNE